MTVLKHPGSPIPSASGQSGKYLTTNGSELSWGQIATAFTLINAGGTSLSGAATITVSGLGNYTDLYIFFANASTASSAADITLRLNEDSGANYARAGFWLGWGASNAVTGNGTGSISSSSFNMGKTNGTSGEAFGTLQISRASSTGIKPVVGWGSGNATGGELWTAFGHYAGSSAISSVSLISNGGNFDAGTLYIYGAN